MSLPFRLPRPVPNRSASRNDRLHPYVAFAARYWAFIIAAGIIGALVGYGLSQLVTPAYNARSTLYFSIGYGASGSDLNQGASYAQGQMLSFAELAGTERVLQPVIDDLGLDQTTAELADQVTVTTPANTVVLDITASSTDPELAASIANGVAKSLTSAVLDVAPRDDDGKVTVSVRTVESAAIPAVPASPNTRVNVVAAALIGIVLSLLVIAAIRLLDTRVRGAGGVAAAGGLPVLARLRATSANAFAADPDGAVAEDYRRLIATLDAVSVSATPDASGSSSRRARVFVLASVSASGSTPLSADSTAETGGRLDDAATVGEATASSRATITAANLALAATEAGHRVAVVADAAPESVPDERVTTRSLPARGNLPASLLNTHDLVLIAAPGSAEGSRALRLAQGSDGIVLLADEGRVHIGELRSAIELLGTAGARVVGTVLTTEPRAARRTERPRVVRPFSRRDLSGVLEQNEA